MKCLEIKDGKGYFLNKDKSMDEIDKITKDDILRFLDIAVSSEQTLEMDSMDDKNITNEAHQIIYQNLYNKFEELLNTKDRFFDECQGLYDEAIRKYK